MGILDAFKGKKQVSESNSMFGQTALGNNIVYQGGGQNPTVNTGSTTNAGRPVDMSMLSRNSTVMSCIALKARALAQLPIRIVAEKDGKCIDAVKDKSAKTREAEKAKQVYRLLNNPNNFQSKYEFWYQWLMWYELSGEAFTLWWRANQKSNTETPLDCSDDYAHALSVVSPVYSVLRLQP